MGIMRINDDNQNMYDYTNVKTKKPKRDYSKNRYNVYYNGSIVKNGRNVSYKVAFGMKGKMMKSADFVNKYIYLELIGD